MNISAANHIEKIVSRSNIITVKDLTEGKDLGPIAPFEVLSGEDEAAGKFQIALSGGSNGSIAQVTPDIFMGVDRGPGKRTGIQSFIDNDVVSIMAIPGVTDPNVQLSLVAHCENLGSRFAFSIFRARRQKWLDVMTHRNIFD